MSANEFFVALVSAREDAKAAHAEVARLTAELARAELHRDTYRDAWQTVAAEIAELRAQEPVGEVDTYHKHVYLQVPWESLPNHSKVFARPVPAAQAMKPLDADIAQMLADNAESLYVSSPAPQPPADHVPDAGKTIGETLPPESHWCAAGVEPCPCAVATLKDAARYQWLRGRAYKDGATLSIEVAVIYDLAIGDFGEFIDETADAAMQKGAQ